MDFQIGWEYIKILKKLSEDKDIFKLIFVI